MAIPIIKAGQILATANRKAAKRKLTPSELTRTNDAFRLARNYMKRADKRSHPRNEDDLVRSFLDFGLWGVRTLEPKRLTQLLKQVREVTTDDKSYTNHPKNKQTRPKFIPPTDLAKMTKTELQEILREHNSFMRDQFRTTEKYGGKSRGVHAYEKALKQIIKDTIVPGKTFKTMTDVIRKGDKKDLLFAINRLDQLNNNTTNNIWGAMSEAKTVHSLFGDVYFTATEDNQNRIWELFNKIKEEYTDIKSDQVAELIDEINAGRTKSALLTILSGKITDDDEMKDFTDKVIEEVLNKRPGFKGAPKSDALKGYKIVKVGA